MSALHVFEHHTGPVTDLLFTNGTLYSSSIDTTVVAIDFATGRLSFRCTDHKTAVLHLSSADNLIFTASLDGRVRFIDSRTGRVEGTFPNHGHGQIYSLLSTNDRLFVGCEDGVVLCYDNKVPILRQTLFWHNAPVTALAAGTLGGRPVVYSGSHDRSIHVFDLNEREEVGEDAVKPPRDRYFVHASQGYVTSLQTEKVDNDGNTKDSVWATYSDGRIRLWGPQIRQAKPKKKVAEGKGKPGGRLPSGPRAASAPPSSTRATSAKGSAKGAAVPAAEAAAKPTRAKFVVADAWLGEWEVRRTLMESSAAALSVAVLEDILVVAADSPSLVYYKLPNTSVSGTPLPNSSGSSTTSQQRFEVRKLEGHSDGQTKVIFAQGLLYSASYDHTVRVWDPLQATRMGEYEGRVETEKQIVRARIADIRRLRRTGSNSLNKRSLRVGHPPLQQVDRTLSRRVLNPPWSFVVKESALWDTGTIPYIVPALQIRVQADEKLKAVVVVEVISKLEAPNPEIEVNDHLMRIGSVEVSLQCSALYALDEAVGSPVTCVLAREIAPGLYRPFTQSVQRLSWEENTSSIVPPPATQLKLSYRTLFLYLEPLLVVDMPINMQLDAVQQSLSLNLEVLMNIFTRFSSSIKVVAENEVNPKLTLTQQEMLSFCRQCRICRATLPLATISRWLMELEADHSNTLTMCVPKSFAVKNPHLPSAVFSAKTVILTLIRIADHLYPELPLLAERLDLFLNHEVQAYITARGVSKGPNSYHPKLTAMIQHSYQTLWTVYAFFIGYEWPYSAITCGQLSEFLQRFPLLMERTSGAETFEAMLLTMVSSQNSHAFAPQAFEPDRELTFEEFVEGLLLCVREPHQTLEAASTADTLKVFVRSGFISAAASYLSELNQANQVPNPKLRGEQRRGAVQITVPPPEYKNSAQRVMFSSALQPHNTLSEALDSLSD